MGYPYDKTYLEQIQSNPGECDAIENAYYILRRKYVNEHPEHCDTADLTIKENFALLGEAFELASSTVDSIVDVYHFMWDVVDVLLTSPEEHNQVEQIICTTKNEEENSETL